MADAFNTFNPSLKQGVEQEAKSENKPPPKIDPRLLTLVWDGERALVFPTRLVQDLITENSIGLLAGEGQAGTQQQAFRRAKDGLWAKQLWASGASMCWQWRNHQASTKERRCQDRATRC